MGILAARRMRGAKLTELGRTVFARRSFVRRSSALLAISGFLGDRFVWPTHFGLFLTRSFGGDACFRTNVCNHLIVPLNRGRDSNQIFLELRELRGEVHSFLCVVPRRDRER